MKHLLTAFAFTALLAPAAHAEDILSILERQSQNEQPSPPALNPYNYTVDVIMSGKEGKDILPPFTARLLIDPSAEPQTRATIVSVSSPEHPDEFKEFLKEIQNPESSAEDLAEEFWCESGDNELFEGDEVSADSFTVLSESETEAVIKPNLALMAQIMMDGDDDDMSKSERKMMKKMMERLDGEFVLSKPDARLKRLKIWLTRPMTMAVIAKIKEMDITQSCAMAPNGFTYRDSMTMHVKAKALGMGMEQDMDIKISGLTLR
ncbi:MAG: hypothetical protein ABJN69_09540 [Hellea sp.]